MKIKMSDIRKRLKLITQRLNENYSSDSIRSYCTTSYKAIESKQANNICRCIQASAFKSGCPVQMETVLDLYESLIEYGTISDINKMGSFIIENAVPKVRDSKDLNFLMHRRLGRIKTKATTGINKQIEELMKPSIDINITNTDAANQANNPPSAAATPQVQAKTDAVAENYIKMFDESIKYIHCDRILENYEMVSKRFNLERLFEENFRINGTYDTIIELCRFIDTYDMPEYAKINAVLETAWYGFSINHCDYSPKEVLEVCRDYFQIKGSDPKAFDSILEANVVFPSSLLDSDSKEISVVAEGKTIVIKEDADFDKLFKEWKEKNEEKADTNKLKMFIRSMYTKNPSNVISGSPKILRWVRMFIVLSTNIITPWLGIPMFIVDALIQADVDKSEARKMLKCLKKEIDETNKKINSTNDKEEKTKLEKYLKSVKDAYDKIDTYYNETLSDAELDRKYDPDSESYDTFGNMLKDDKTVKGMKLEHDPMRDTDGGGKYDDIDFENMSDDDLDKFLAKLDSGDMDDDDDLSFDFDFEESAVLIPHLAMLCEAYNNVASKTDIGDKLNATLNVMDNKDIDNVAKIASTFPNEFGGPDLLDAINSEERAIRKNKHKFQSVLDRFDKLNTYANATACIEAALTEAANHVDDNIINVNIHDAIYEMYSRLTYANSINQLLLVESERNTLLETTFANKAKMASIKLQKAVQNASDKEKTISKNVDVATRNFMKKAEESLTNGNREAVIKGSILPSASKIIKMAIATGFAWLINPVVAIIGVLGYIACSAKYRAKERQMVLDEIEIELKMCQKYIDIAESKNDMKALRQLMTIQRNLERQRQRIKYKMRVDYGQKVYDSKLSNVEDSTVYESASTEEFNPWECDVDDSDYIITADANDYHPEERWDTFIRLLKSMEPKYFYATASMNNLSSFKPSKLKLPESFNCKDYGIIFNNNKELVVIHLVNKQCYRIRYENPMICFEYPKSIEDVAIWAAYKK